MKNDNMSGFKSYKNTQKFTVESLYEVLKDVPVSFAIPELGTMGKHPAIVYSIPEGRMDVYITIPKNKILLSRSFKQNAKMGKEVAKELALGLLLNAADAKDTQVAETYVEEVDGILQQIMEGKTEIVSKAANAETGETLDFYMKQKLLSIKDKYSIFDESGNECYYVEGNLLGLSFKINDATGRELYTIQKKMVSITPEYTLVEDGKKIGHIKKKIKLMKAEILGDIKKADLAIKGNIQGYAFTIELDGKIVGSVSSARLAWGDCYDIKVMDPEIKDLVVAIAIICDNSIKHADSKF